jgi:ribose 5-phosphate isomerase A
LVREKMVASASDRVIIIVDESKLVSRLGEHAPLPVEILRFGAEVTERRLVAAGATITRRTAADGSLFLTDNGNHIVDCRFGLIADPAALADRLKRLVGVVETGLFIGLATAVVIGAASGIRRLP